MLEQALKNDDAPTWLCPVVFSYRHTLELYLKTLGDIDEHTHSLAECADLVEKRHGKKFSPQVKRWIMELDKIDPDPGTAFRYEDNQKSQNYAEFWIDLVQFKFAMSKVFQMIDMAVLSFGNLGEGET